MSKSKLMSSLLARAVGLCLRELYVWLTAGWAACPGHADSHHNAVRARERDSRPHGDPSAHRPLGVSVGGVELLTTFIRSRMGGLEVGGGEERWADCTRWGRCLRGGACCCVPGHSHRTIPPGP